VARRPGRRAPRWPRIALLVHNWLGLKLALVLSIVLLSGTLAVFKAEIDWLLYPQKRVTPTQSLATLEEILAAVRATYPDIALVGDVPTGIDSGHSAIGMIGVSPQRGVRMIWVDPYRGVVQGDTPLMTLGFFLANLHRDLFIPGWGLPIVCAMAILVALSLVTGLLGYRRFWRGFVLRPRFSSWRTLMGDLHRLVGVWSIWFMLVISATGLWYFWTFVGEPMLGFPHAVQERARPGLPAERLDALGPGTPRTTPLATALSNITAQFPDFAAQYVALPSHHDAPLVFRGSRGETLAPYATTFFVDPFPVRSSAASLSATCRHSNASVLRSIRFTSVISADWFRSSSGSSSAWL
jgi:PepSY-associated TM region